MSNEVRERSRELLRAELAEAAADYCARVGFSSVTTDDLAQGIGISRATFFRYFRSKEDAVVLSARWGRVSVSDELASQDALAGTKLFDMVRRALEPTVAQARSDPERLRTRIAMISDHPVLRARLAADRADQGAALAEVMSTLIEDAAQARAVSASTMAAIDVGWSLWIDGVDADLGEAFRRAFDLVAQAGSLTVR